jgi:hypothetical protein
MCLITLLIPILLTSLTTACKCIRNDNGQPNDDLTYGCCGYNSPQGIMDGNDCVDSSMKISDFSRCCRAATEGRKHKKAWHSDC